MSISSNYLFLPQDLPSADCCETFTHDGIGKCVRFLGSVSFYNPGPNCFEGPSPKNSGAQNMQTLAQFITGRDKDIQNRTTTTATTTATAAVQMVISSKSMAMFWTDLSQTNSISSVLYCSLACIILLLLYHTSHGSVGVVRTTSKSMGKGKLWPSANQKPLNRHQIWMAWLRRGRLPPKKFGLNSPRDFRSP